ncbi:hypothetical protein KM043_017866 [Ampulex compressa]|nr:hypothetical protein KM043_017866 [Ampulex compressa]
MAEEVQEKKEGKTPEIIHLKRNETVKNPATFDNICKEVIFRNRVLRCKWPEKYQHLTGEFFSSMLDEEWEKTKLPRDTVKHVSRPNGITNSPISLKPSPSIPKTTYGEIGFRSSRPEYNLEFTGRMYSSPKWTIEPVDDCNTCNLSKQRFIFLG